MIPAGDKLAMAAWLAPIVSARIAREGKMHSRKLWIPGVLLFSALVLAACGETKTEKAEVATCKKLARAVLHNPESFKVGDTKVDETSEGVEIFVEIDYSGAEGSGHVSDKCWFAGYSEVKPLKSFFYRSDPNGQYVELPDDELQAILKQMQG